jgi:hypothetical protein
VSRAFIDGRTCACPRARASACPRARVPACPPLVLPEPPACELTPHVPASVLSLPLLLRVARIEMQARAINGEASKSMMQILRAVHAESGLRGLFQGLLPRMGLNINLTLFMVSGSKIVKSLRESSEREGARIVRHAQLTSQARKQVDYDLRL